MVWLLASYYNLSVNSPYVTHFPICNSIQLWYSTLATASCRSLLYEFLCSILSEFHNRSNDSDIERVATTSIQISADSIKKNGWLFRASHEMLFETFFAYLKRYRNRGLLNGIHFGFHIVFSFLIRIRQYIIY